MGQKLTKAGKEEQAKAKAQAFDRYLAKFLDKGYEQSVAECLAEVFAEDFAKDFATGWNKQTSKIAKRMLRHGGISIEEIASYTELPISKVKDLRAKLKKKHKFK